MKVAILSPFYASGVLDRNEIETLSLRIQHPHSWIKNLAEALANIGVDIHIVTINNEFTQDTKFERNNVKYVFLKSAGKIKRFLTMYEIDKLRIHDFLKKEGFDLVHGQGMNKFGYYAVTSGIPHVLTIHLYMSAIDHLKEINKFQVMRLYLILVALLHKRKVHKFATKIISISPVIRQILAQKSLTTSIYDIENAVHPDFFQDIGKKNTEGYCLYVGSISERKNILGLVEALEYFTIGKLKIISQTVGGDYFLKVKKYIEDKKLVCRVQFLGPKENHEIVGYLQKAIFLVLPSLKEMAPMVISEAMAAGKPVVSTAVDGIPYMVEEGETGFIVPPYDSQSLAEKMEFLFANTTVCQKMGEKARMEAGKRWHPEVVARKTSVVYKEILAQREPRNV